MVVGYLLFEGVGHFFGVDGKHSDVLGGQLLHQFAFGENIEIAKDSHGFFVYLLLEGNFLPVLLCELLQVHHSYVCILGDILLGSFAIFGHYYAAGALVRVRQP